MKKAVIFDMDGVIIDSEPLYEVVQQRGLASYGIDLGQDDFQRFKGLSEEAVFDILENDYGVKWDRKQVSLEARQALLKEFRLNLGYMDGFPRIMDNIPDGFMIGLVTSTKRPVLDEVDKICSVKKYFSEIVAGGDTMEAKPHPAPYLEMMRRMQVDAGNTVVIEDSLNGVKSGLAAGANVIGLSATHPCEQLAEAHVCVNSLDEITSEIIIDLVNDK